MSEVIVNLRRYRLPFRTPVRTAHGWWREREGWWIRIEDGAGRVGWGEAAPVPGFPGPDVTAVGERLQAWAGRQSAAALAEAAAAGGVIGFAVGTALAELAGEPSAEGQTEGEDTRLVAALLPAGREALARVGPLLQAGFRVFKWKVGVAEGQDERAMLDDLVARLPETARLRLDANGAWNRREAERWLSVVAERPVEFVEQPIAPDARGGDDVLRGLAADYPTPLALDESLAGPEDLAKWLAWEWRGVWVLKPALLGDPAATLARLRVREADVVFSTAMETAVGLRAALRAAWSWTGGRRALGFGVGAVFELAAANGPALAAWWRRRDIETLDPEAAWNALS
jgi:o-succinylbenzoate synthase